MSYAGMNACFRGLIVFFALSADEQASLYADFPDERRFDLADGDLFTLFPLEVFTASIKHYANWFTGSGGVDDSEIFDMDLCGQIRALAEAISDHEWAVKGETPPYFSRENLAKKSIWKVMRMLCRQLADTHSISVTPDQLSLEDLLYKC